MNKDKSSQPESGDFADQAMPYMGAMYAVALRLTRNRRDAEDLVQDALLRGFRFFDRFQQGTNLRAWLIKVMTNIFLNKIKKTSRRPGMVEFETIEELIGELEEDWLGISSRGEGFREFLNDDVAAALDELPIDYRIPVLLSAIDGLSYKEIAQTVGCPVGTVMSRLYRGRRMLEQRLCDYARKIGFFNRRESRGYDEV